MKSNDTLKSKIKLWLKSYSNTTYFDILVVSSRLEALWDSHSPSLNCILNGPMSAPNLVAI